MKQCLLDIRQIGKGTRTVMLAAKNHRYRLFYIGRPPIDPEVPPPDVAIGDMTVSCLHAKLMYGRWNGVDADPCWRLLDMRSTNGTEVNGRLLGTNEWHVLRYGDVIRVGRTTITFRLPN